MSEIPKEKPIFCNTCRGVTRHRYVGSQEYFGEHESGDYILWTCAGCDAGTMEDLYTAVYEDGLISILHPKRMEHERPRKSFRALPKKLTELYAEVLSAHNSTLNVLCAIGLRALLEGICADKKITGRDLKKKINRMTGHVPVNIVKNLHGFRFMGNNAAHELAAPESFELGIAIDLMEDILNFLYDFDYKAKMLASIPAAQLSKPKNPA